MHTSCSDGNRALAERRNLSSVLLLTGHNWGELIVCDREKSMGTNCRNSSGQQGANGSQTTSILKSAFSSGMLHRVG
jgi:hypothetical protein